MPQHESYLPHYTYDDYLHWEGRWELIEGYAIAMSPLPIPRHQELSLNIMIALRNGLKEGGCKTCKVYPPLDYKIDEHTIVQPDVLVVCGKIIKKYLDFVPALVVEVLSPATIIKDKNKKFHLYEQQGIGYYLLVDLDKQKVEIYKLEEGQYKLGADEDNYVFDFGMHCKARVKLADIWND